MSTFPLDSLAETKSRLSIECVAESDAAVYECVAENEADRLTAETKVAVSSSLGGNGDACLSRRLASSRVSPPAIHQWMGTYLQVMGTDAHLICRADGNAAEIVWMDPNDDVIEYDGDKYLPLSNGDLIVRDLDFGDMGMFKCVARNEFGEDMKETFVFPTAAVRSNTTIIAFRPRFNATYFTCRHKLGHSRTPLRFWRTATTATSEETSFGPLL